MLGLKRSEGSLFAFGFFVDLRPQGAAILSAGVDPVLRDSARGSGVLLRTGTYRERRVVGIDRTRGDGRNRGSSFRLLG